MTSPNEPGYTRATEGGGNGSGAAPGPEGGSSPERIADATEVPPWQRGRAASRTPETTGRPDSPSDAPRRGNSGAPSHSPGIDARLNRFLSGGSAASPQEQDAAGWADPPEQSARPEPPAPPARTDQPARPDKYASEIPDLSGAAPRSTLRKPGAERPGQEPANRPAVPAGRPQAATRHQGPVRASMQIRRVDPWSVLKVSAVLSVALFFIWMIAVAFLYLVLGGMGVWSKLNSNVGDLLTSASGSSGGELVSSGTIFGGAALIGLVNIVLLTAGATIGAFIYNLTTDIVGGVEVTLADRD